MKADPYLNCSNCTHEKKEHEFVFGAKGQKERRCNRCPCHRFQTIRRELTHVYDPIKDKVVRRISE